MIDSMPQETHDAILKTIPMGRFGAPSEMADAVAFLASEPAGYITGAILPVERRGLDLAMGAKQAVIVAGARTPIGKAYRGSLNATHGATLGAHAVRAAVERAGVEPQAY